MLNRRRREGRWMESAEMESSDGQSPDLYPSYKPRPFHLLSTHLTSPCLMIGQYLQIEEFGWKY